MYIRLYLRIPLLNFPYIFSLTNSYFLFAHQSKYNFTLFPIFILVFVVFLVRFLSMPTECAANPLQRALADSIVMMQPLDEIRILLACGAKVWGYEQNRNDNICLFRI